ncbi:RtcB family protein [Corallococcus carmarthensis]|uniref:3'-phosphate/5'-hydroxy nucleic acid ligase n=1 Tax=Corallococcus carmarthensis TaxID=2316728 RepID=A0A3A8KR98_9BACT|nr:RtcB family protein [Corallococcus carmarthensis]RKH04494.1 RtcB family protein [Corallococcus carmarthensis]
MDRMNANYEVLSDESGRPIKAWTVGVPFEDEAKKQLRNLRGLPFIHKWVAVMPDVHRGYGATVGSVVPTVGAVVPAAVGVDIGCGMIAVRTTLRADQLPDSLRGVRSAIEAAVPHGRTDNGGRNDRGAWKDSPVTHTSAWARLAEGYAQIVAKHPRIGRGPELAHLGTLGTGNHFIELCVDESDGVWLMLHSGSRGVGNRIGSHFIELAKEDMQRFFIHLPDADLAYLPEGTEHFHDYVFAVSWAQDFAAMNRELMLHSAVEALKASGELPPFELSESAVNCHHNYISREHHFGKNCFVTRKGAVRAREGDMGIIPGSMGARSYIVRGKGNADAFHSCSHGAGRVMSREAAKKRFTLEDHAKATEGVECRKDVDVIDETPAAYKPIDAVMAAQADLVEVVHTLKQVVCVKG